MTELQRLVLARQLCTTGEGRRRRIAARLSLAEVADECGVDAATVAKWEAGARMPRREAALRYYATLEQLGRVTA